MRTTISIDDDLLHEAKVVAARQGTTLAALVEGALREALTRRRASTSSRVPIPVFKGGRGLRPSVDLDDNAATLDLMEGRT